VLSHIFLHKFDAQIRVIYALNLVANTGNYKDPSVRGSSRLHKMNALSLFAFLDWSTNSRGVRPVSRAPENIEAASSRAPPKRLPMVRRPDAREDIRSLPARVATIVFIALRGRLA
jgi:hypothetical protein